MDIFFHICFYVIGASAGLAGVLTCMSLFSMSQRHLMEKKDQQRIWSGLLLFSALLAFDLALIFALTLRPGRLYFDYPIALGTIATFDLLFDIFMIRAAVLSVLDMLRSRNNDQ